MVQAQLAATTPKAGSPGGSPDRLDAGSTDCAKNGGRPEGSDRHSSPPESPDAAPAQGSFHMDESPIRGLLTDGARAAVRRAERLTAAAAAREAAASAAAPVAVAEMAAAAAASSKTVRRRSGGWTPRGSGSSGSGSAAGRGPGPAGPAAAEKKKSVAQPASLASSSSSSSSGSDRSLGRELELFVCGGAPEQPQAFEQTSPAGPALSEGCASSIADPQEEAQLAGSGALMDVVYDLQGGCCALAADISDDFTVASDAGSSSAPARGWAAVTSAAARHGGTPAAQGIPTSARLPSASRWVRASEAASLPRSAGWSAAQLWCSLGFRSASVGVSALGGVVCVGLLLAARRRHAIMAAIRYLLGIFRLYSATLRQLR